MKLFPLIFLAVLLISSSILIIDISFPSTDASSESVNPLEALWVPQSNLDLRIVTLALGIVLFIAIVATTLYFEEEKS